MPEPTLSLPPNVSGPIRGEVLLCVGQLLLEDKASSILLTQEYQVSVTPLSAKKQPPNKPLEPCLTSAYQQALDPSRCEDRRMQSL